MSTTKSMWGQGLLSGKGLLHVVRGGRGVVGDGDGLATSERLHKATEM